jgi:SAM-dependent methyltransferase
MSSYSLTLDEGELARYRLMADRARAAEAGLWATAGIAAGAAVADIGCGPGAVTAVLAEVVGPSGRVAAVDGDPTAVEAAKKSVATAPCTTEIRVAPADDSGLPSEAYDVVMVRHVLAHNGGREQAIVEHVASLLRPGGVAYLVDVDLSMMRISPPDPDLDDLLQRYATFHRALGNDPQVGLRLAELLGVAGLEVLAYEARTDTVPVPPGLRPPSWVARERMVAAGVATEDDVRRWGAALERSDAATARPTLFPTNFIALGKRA